LKEKMDQTKCKVYVDQFESVIYFAESIQQRSLWVRFNMNVEAGNQDHWQIYTRFLMAQQYIGAIKNIKFKMG